VTRRVVGVFVAFSCATTKATPWKPKGATTMANLLSMDFLKHDDREHLSVYFAVLLMISVHEG
jgi:hypothetical protein